MPADRDRDHRPARPGHPRRDHDPSRFGPEAKQPHVLGRVLFRNVAIANSDSGAFAYTHSAINEAFRAVHDLPG